MLSILPIIFLFALWSSVFSVGKIVLEHTSPIFLTGVRMALAGILLTGFVFFTKRKAAFQLNRPQWISIGLLAFFSIYLTNVLEFWGLQYLSAGKTCFIYSLSPFFAALFSYIHFKEKMNARKWLGILIGFMGFIPVLKMQTGKEDLLSAFSFFSWPALAVMGAALCSVYGWVLLRITVKNQALSPFTANGMSMLIGGAFALIHSFFMENWTTLVPSSFGSPVFVKGAVFMTLIYNILCYNLYGWMLKRFTATFLSFMGLLSPIFASLVGMILLNEPLSPEIFISTAVVSLGLWIVYRAEIKQGYIASAKPVTEISNK